MMRMKAMMSSNFIGQRQGKPTSIRICVSESQMPFIHKEHHSPLFRLGHRRKLFHLTDSMRAWCIWHDFVVYQNSELGWSFWNIRTHETWQEEQAQVLGFLSTPDILFVSDGRNLCLYKRMG